MSKELWEAEYQKKGIPSSFRETPTRLVKIFTEKYNMSGNALDVGCGKGRNSIFLAANGYNVYSIDYVKYNIDELNEKAKAMNLNLKGICQSVIDPLPFPDNYFDLIIDIFCYKHQISEDARKKYRNEVRRVLKPTGFFVLSLAGKKDGFYGSLLKPGSNVIIDPYTNIASVLFTKDEFEREFTDFQINEFLPTSDESPMHGKTYLRETLNFIMKKRV